MQSRIYIPAELDALQADGVVPEIDIDSADFVGRALLFGVYTDGRFEIMVGDNDRLLTLWLGDCKVFH